MRSLLLLAIASLSAPPLTPAHLANLTYALGEHAAIEGGKVPLVNGRFVDPASGHSFALDPRHAFGDLDGDGDMDAVALLNETAGNNSRFVYLFAIANRDGSATQLGEPEWLGDRTVVERLGIDRRGVVSVRYRTHADGDAACCPTMRIEDRYRVENGRLTGIVNLLIF